MTAPPAAALPPARSVPRSLLALLSALALTLSLMPVLPASAETGTFEVAFFDFEGNTTAPSRTATGFEVSELTAAAGDITFVAGNPGRAATRNGWNNDDQFLEFTVTPPEGGVELDGFGFDDSASNTGPQSWAVSIIDELDGATTETVIGDSDETGGTGTNFRSWSVDLGDLDERTEPFAIRIRGFDASGAGGTYRVDNLSLTGLGEAEPGPDPDPQPTCTVEADDITLISEVQGPGSASPITGQTVTVEALVTLDSAELNGVFIQEEREDWVDEDTNSQGLFVFRGGNYAGADLNPGETVQVTGRVSEFFGLTQMTSINDVELCDVEPVEVEPVELPLPSSPDERERFESMLVTASDLVVSGSFLAWQRQELITGHEGELPSATEVAAPGPDAEAALVEINAREVRLNDRFGSDFSRSIWDADPERRLGDRIDEVTGVLNFSFGNFKIEYTEFPEFELFGAPEVPRLAAGNDIGAFNVLNFFQDFDGRGARNADQFALQSKKIVATILELDPAVLGLIELQNDYLLDVDGDDSTQPSVGVLVDLLNDAAGEDRYAYVSMPEDQLLVDDSAEYGGGVGSDAIANGIIYQPAKATQVGQAATFDIDAGLSGDDRKNRWPFAASFDIDGEVSTVIVNHFKSKGSNCLNVIGPDFGAGEDVSTGLLGSCNLTRTYAAEQILEWSRTDPTGVNDPDVFVVGDLNSYAKEDPIKVFEDAGFVNTVAKYDDGAFTYKFSGRVGTLDYILASPSAARLVDDAQVWQTNSRASYVDLYFVADDTTVANDNLTKGASDHDSLVISIAAPGRGPGAGGPPFTPPGPPGQGNKGRGGQN